MAKFIKIKPNDITIDHRFQRELDQARVDAMTKAYKPELFGVPVVSRREDETIVALDAQHRLAANKAAGHGDVPVLCEVHEGLTVKQEARLFLDLNSGRKPVRTYDKFKARLVAKDPVALEIAAIVKAAGLRISKSSGANSVCAIEALEHVYHRGCLVEVLGVLTRWSKGSPDTFDGVLIRGMSAFLGEYADAVDTGDLVAKLATSTNSPDRVLGKIKGVHRSFKDQLTMRLAAISVFRDIYNKNRARDERLPPPQDVSN